MRGIAIRQIVAVGLGAAVVASAGVAPADTSTCSTTFTSTFAAIQTVIFEKRGCTSAACHDASAQGGLNLLPDVAYQNLVNQPAQTVPGWFRVFPGQRDRSLLFQNTAAYTEPDQYKAPLRYMPLGGLPALSTDELEALRLWIENGAPRDATVAGTADLLDACLPPAVPIQIDPLPPPPAGTGVQIHMPRWIVGHNSEHEVCYASYYDITDQVPPEYLSADGTALRLNKTEIRQDPLSHHLIVNLYNGDKPITDKSWGTFTCRGGAADGQPCNPLDTSACGADSGCANDPEVSVACFGAKDIPSDAAVGVASSGFTGTQKAATTITYAPGVYNEMPLKGIFIWDSHAFNTTNEDGKLEAWLNFYFAPPDQQQYPLHGIFVTSNKGGKLGFEVLFKPDVPAFKAEEVCNIFTTPPDANLFELSSHMHHRGARWRTWEGAWTCQGGENDGAPCSPNGPDTQFQTTDLCAGAPCQSKLPPRTGDCNGDLTVTIDELVTGVNIALGTEPLSSCPRFDMNDTGNVTIADLVAAVASASQAPQRDADASLLYTNYIYNDPLVLDFDPIMFMGGKASLPEERSITYCALYDNGFSDPTKVKMQSTSPPTPLGIPGLLGGPCVTPTGCTKGKVGTVCSGNTPAARNASCDSTSGAGDGLCDACELKGGVTTEDEMFLLLGSYFIK